jgi:hypothetical protein
MKKKNVQSCATAHLYRNGHAFYGNEKGEKIPELEELGLSGLHKFVEKHPGAPVYWCFSYERTRINPVALLNLLRHIRAEPSSK